MPHTHSGLESVAPPTRPDGDGIFWLADQGGVADILIVSSTEIPADADRGCRHCSNSVEPDEIENSPHGGLPIGYRGRY